MHELTDEEWVAIKEALEGWKRAKWVLGSLATVIPITTTVLLGVKDYLG